MSEFKKEEMNTTEIDDEIEEIEDEFDDEQEEQAEEEVGQTEGSTRSHASGFAKIGLGFAAGFAAGEIHARHKFAKEHPECFDKGEKTEKPAPFWTRIHFNWPITIEKEKKTEKDDNKTPEPKEGGKKAEK